MAMVKWFSRDGENAEDPEWLAQCIVPEIHRRNAISPVLEHTFDEFDVTAQTQHGHLWSKSSDARWKIATVPRNVERI